MASTDPAQPFMRFYQAWIIVFWFHPNSVEVDPVQFPGAEVLARLLYVVIAF